MHFMKKLKVKIAKQSTGVDICISRHLRMNGGVHYRKTIAQQLLVN